MTEISMKEYLQARFDSLEKKFDDVHTDNKAEFIRLWKYNTVQDDKIGKLSNKIAYACGGIAAVMVIIQIASKYI